MVHSMGDAFSDIYTFTAYENEMGELFLAEWLFDMGILWTQGPIIVLSNVYVVSMLEIEAEFVLIVDETHIHIKFHVKKCKLHGRMIVGHVGHKINYI